jgi:hypothetical protein
MGEIEVALTEEFETTVAEQAEDLAVGETDGEAAVIDFQEAGDGEAVDVDATVEGEADVALGGTKVQHAARERGRACQWTTRSGSASAANWSSCTCRWSSTWRAGSGTAASGSTT